DAIVESDEALMEKYLGEGDVSADELAGALPRALAAGTIVPIFCTSSKAGKDIGVQELLDALAQFAPSPKVGAKRKAIKGTGDKAAVAKVGEWRTGDPVSNHAGAPKLAPSTLPGPMYGLAIEPKARGDEQKISGSLQKIADEDPTFKITRDSQTKEMVITGMSQLHLDIVQKRLKARYDLEVITHEPKIPYRETITVPGEAEHQHKKQTGGRGQYAKVLMRIYPLQEFGITTKEEFFEKFANKSRFEKLRVDSSHYEPQHDFGFIDHIVGGSIPNQFIPAIEKGCKELLDMGALAGFRIQGV